MRAVAAAGLVLLAGCGGAAPAPPAPPSPPQAASDVSALEAQNYIDLFATQDTPGWEVAKKRLVNLGPGALPALFKALQERPGNVAFHCQDVLKRMGEPVIPAALQEIRAGDAGTSGKALVRRRQYRYKLVSVIGEMRAPGSAAALSEVLRGDPWETVRRAAAFYLGEIRDPASVEALITALRTEESEEVRATILGALRACAGRDLGPSPDVWEAWWKDRS